MTTPQWLGLLRWTMQHSDGTQVSQSSAMSEEDKAWLTKVMKEAVRDDVQRMNEIITLLQNTFTLLVENSQAEVDLETLCVDLDELQEIVEQIDMSLVFIKCRGWTLSLDYLYLSLSLCQASSPLAFSLQPLVLGLTGVLATAVQNHQQVQEMMLGEVDYTLPPMPSLLPVPPPPSSTVPFASPPAHSPPLSGLSPVSPPASPASLLDHLVALSMQCSEPKVMTKILSCISCLIRGHALGEESFSLSHLPSLCARLLSLPPSSSSASPFTKLFFLLSALLSSDSASLPRIAIIVDCVLALVLRRGNTIRERGGREQMEACMITVLRTEYGHSVGGERLGEYVESAERESGGEEGEGEEDQAERIRRREEILHAIANKQVLYPAQSNNVPPPPLSENDPTPNNNTDETEEGETPPPVLMIGGPDVSLEARNLIP